ncbi:MAG: LysR family transcriptional regulator [Porticoccaceae bacterium]|nr:LysR family transcriptional regulator [Porticoccaceae bacterium]
MIESKLLRNALTLAEKKNFARAAKALHISQPTLTRSIQLLESRVGEQLFDRLTSGVVATQAGEIVLKHARIILDSTAAMQEEVDRHQGIFQGLLHVASGPYVASSLLAPAIAQFINKHPYIEIDTVVDEWSQLPSRMLREGFDFALGEVSEIEEPNNFDCLELNPHPVFLFCRKGHPLLGQGDQSILKALPNFPLVSPTIPKRSSLLIDKLFSTDRGDEPAETQCANITIGDQAMIKALIMQTDGIGIGSYGTLATELNAGLFSVIPIRFRELATQYGIVRRKGLSPSPAALALIDLLVQIDNEQCISEQGLIDSLGKPKTLKTQGF